MSRSKILPMLEAFNTGRQYRIVPQHPQLLAAHQCIEIGNQALGTRRPVHKKPETQETLTLPEHGAMDSIEIHLGRFARLVPIVNFIAETIYLETLDLILHFRLEYPLRTDTKANASRTVRVAG